MPDFIKAIGAARFGVMAGVAAALTAFFLYVAGVISEPPKSILFSGLESRDAAAVSAKLDALNVPYDAKGDGGTIMVPADQVTKLRMELAQDNLPAAGVGYEIFDKSDAFGTTAFVQNINRLRALEGELARSIRDHRRRRERRACIWSCPSASYSRATRRRPAPRSCQDARRARTADRSAPSGIWSPPPSPALKPERVADHRRQGQSAGAAARN